MIIGIEGGIGTGKTLTLVHYMYNAFQTGKILYSNINLNIQNKSNFNLVDSKFIKRVLYLVKEKRLIMKNSFVGLQEIHNYMDSRNSMSETNKLISYWILQSRHTGEGSCTIMYDTQDIGQVDIRLRRNTDLLIRPTIIKWQDQKPKVVYLHIMGKVGHKIKQFQKVIDVSKILNKYNTHEVVDI